jgi:phosphonate metabolism protein PhnN/1,5-bisphosphokinase (PRPP-forming)
MTSIVVISHRLLVVVGPSGAGKDSVISAWLQRQPEAVRPHRARRTITRPADVHEAHESISASAFAAAREAGAFAFHWHAHGLDYGIRHGELAALSEGGWVVMNGSREHLAQLRAVAPQARVVEIDAPATLRQRRLHDRSREDADGRAARLVRQTAPAAADLRIVNDGSLDQAVAALDGWWKAVAAAHANGDCGISTPGAAAIGAET